MPSFPGALSALITTRVTGDPSPAADYDAAAAEINAIEAELGIHPSGSATTVVARLEAIEAAKANLADPAFTGTVTVPTPTAGATSSAAVPASFVTLTTINTRTAGYTLALVDGLAVVGINSASAVVVTVPTNDTVAFPVGSSVEIMRYGAGTVTITPAAGVTIPNAVEVAGTASRTITGRMLSATLLKVATNEWVLQGAIA